MPKDLVVVAMSGGVDSSVAAALMCKKGYDVIGITLQLYDHGSATASSKACCAGQDIYDASMVASKLNIPHYVFDYETKFSQEVIDNFADTYLKGQTPLPCVRCNQSVKFRDLLRAAKELGAKKLITGHYVRKLQGNQLHQAVDEKKDQSYFLFSTTKEQLEYLEFPLGEMNKEQARKIARENGLLVHDKPDSQDICFVPEGSYSDLVKKLRPNSATEGDIMHVDGYKLGRHLGIINYTIGQRRGIGIAFQYPLYVVSIDPKENIVYVGPEEALYRKEFFINDYNWIGDGEMPQEGLEVKTKIRHHHKAVLAKLYPKDNNLIRVEFFCPTSSIAPGQAAVFYDSTRVLGGGWIT